MSPQPALHTERLILRPFRPEDAPAVQRLAGDPAIASTTTNIPHPYEDGLAEQWISNHAARYEAGECATFAITLRESGELIGAIGLEISREHRRAELGYWVGVPWWNQGYCTEAARALVAYGFRELSLHRIYAMHFRRNPASGKVMRKIGMRHEGSLRQHVSKWGTFEDVEVYGILREEFEAAGDR